MQITVQVAFDEQLTLPLSPTVRLQVAPVQPMLLLGPVVRSHIEPGSQRALHESPHSPEQVASCEHTSEQPPPVQPLPDDQLQSAPEAQVHALPVHAQSGPGQVDVVVPPPQDARANSAATKARRIVGMPTSSSRTVPGQVPGILSSVLSPR